MDLQLSYISRIVVPMWRVFSTTRKKNIKISKYRLFSANPRRSRRPPEVPITSIRLIRWPWSPSTSSLFYFGHPSNIRWHLWQPPLFLVVLRWTPKAPEERWWIRRQIQHDKSLNGQCWGSRQGRQRYAQLTKWIKGKLKHPQLFPFTPGHPHLTPCPPLLWGRGRNPRRVKRTSRQTQHSLTSWT